MNRFDVLQPNHKIQGISKGPQVWARIFLKDLKYGTLLFGLFTMLLSLYAKGLASRDEDAENEDDQLVDEDGNAKEESRTDYLDPKLHKLL